GAESVRTRSGHSRILGPKRQSLPVLRRVLSPHSALLEPICVPASNEVTVTILYGLEHLVTDTGFSLCLSQTGHVWTVSPRPRTASTCSLRPRARFGILCAVSR
ncbi:hypothetical protein CERSUDRAFT_114252, partial [Gelatoporia subvermispora B]